MSLLKMQNASPLSAAMFLFYASASKSCAFDALAQNKNASLSAGTFCALSDPAGIRTQDPYIKSVMLYRLSYGIVFIHTSVELQLLSQEPLFYKNNISCAGRFEGDLSNRAANIVVFYSPAKYFP